MTVLAPAELVERIWAHDPAVWTGADEAQWLGWLDEPLRMRERADELVAFAGEADVDDVVLLGMGGSSLAPLVLGRAFGAERFHVLDTTHPRAVARLAASLDPGRTLFVASSKSGTTIETRCQLDYFRGLGGSFVAVTDPGSPLERAEGIGRVFHGEPTIGGRYSALSFFGLAPGALLGVPGLLKAENLFATATGAGDSHDVSAQSSVTLERVEVLSGLITAELVVAIAGSAIHGTATSSNADGATFAGLVVNGVPIGADVAPNTRIDLPGVGYVVLNERLSTGDGTKTTGLTVRMIHVVLRDAVTGATTGEIVVGAASSYVAP